MCSKKRAKVFILIYILALLIELFRLNILCRYLFFSEYLVFNHSFPKKNLNELKNIINISILVSNQL